jgi:hypothetical protein
MTGEQKKSVAKFLKEGTELFTIIHDSRKDGKIRIREWFKIFNEGSDAFNALKEMTGIEVAKMTDDDIQSVVLTFNGYLHTKPWFNPVIAVEVLKIARSVAVIGNVLK